MTSPLPDAWLPIEQIAAVFHVTTRTIRRYIHASPPLIHPTTETRGGRNYRKLISVREVAAIPHLVCDGDLLEAMMQRSSSTILERLSEIESKLAYLQEITRQDAQETPPNKKEVSHYSYTALERASKTQSASDVRYLAGVRISYFQGIVSKNCCVKLAAAHGAGYAGADRWRWPPDQRATPEAVILFIHAYMTRERSPLRFRLCNDPDCPCQSAAPLTAFDERKQ